MSPAPSSQPTLAFAVLACAILGSAFQPTAGAKAGEAEEPGAALLASLAKLARQPEEEIWPAVADLRKTYKDSPAALKDLAEKVYGLEGGAKLAGAALLFSRKEPTFQASGQVALQQVARDGTEKAIRIAAIRLLRQPVRLTEAFLALKSVADSAADPDVKIEASLALWELDNSQAMRAPLIRLLADARPATRRRAALALAETGYFEPPVDEILRALRDEPSELGKRAALHLRLKDRNPPRHGENQGADAPPSRPRPNGEPAPPEGTFLGIVSEVERLIAKHSIRRDGIQLRNLYAAALEGMASSLDEYSTFQDPDELRQVEAGRLGTYWGLGADLVKPSRTAPLVVAKAHAGGPAYLAGIRTGDRILEVNGVTTHDRDRVELERLTVGSPGDEVRLSITRWGLDIARMYTVRRGEVELPTLRSQLLPAKVGYIQLLRVGPLTGAEFERALDGLEARGMQALVVDLRDNSGGNLKQAVKVVDLFVGLKPEPITRERAPGRETDWWASPDEKPYHPMAILVNRATASAAEVIAGALQDFQRAVIVGQRTFGKGVKQSSFPLSAPSAALLGGETRVLLTTGILYLPLGRSLQAERGPDGRPLPGREGGVAPDVLVEDAGEGQIVRQSAELLRVQYSPEVDAYIHRNFTQVKHLYEEGDLWDPGQYPGFEDLYASLHTRLTRAEVRHALRTLVRRHLEEEKGGELPVDHREDPGLQRGILEVCRRAGLDPASIPEYRSAAERLEASEGDGER